MGDEERRDCLRCGFAFSGCSCVDEADEVELDSMLELLALDNDKADGTNTLLLSSISSRCLLLLF
jgi:DTW domain-containing protein YfiP